MNAGKYIEFLKNSTSNIKYKPDIQPTNVADCTINNLTSFSSGLQWSRYVTKMTEGPSEICTQPTYKELLLPKYSPTATDEHTNTATPTIICQSNSYKNILKRVGCNTMNGQ
jgi:hypothetical protein